jgi:hypothetical protein
MSSSANSSPTLLTIQDPPRSELRGLGGTANARRQDRQLGYWARTSSGGSGGVARAGHRVLLGAGEVVA